MHACVQTVLYAMYYVLNGLLFIMPQCIPFVVIYCIVFVGISGNIQCYSNLRFNKHVNKQITWSDYGCSEQSVLRCHRHPLACIQ